MSFSSAKFLHTSEGRPSVPSETPPDQTLAPVGGRVSGKGVRELIDAVSTLAEKRGFPKAAGPDSRIAFGPDAAGLIRRHMDLSWAEAGNRDVCGPLSLVALPHVTLWRFGRDNRERWVATDLTRHTWARLWWQAVVFARHEQILVVLSESDLNQLLERPAQAATHART